MRLRFLRKRLVELAAGALMLLASACRPAGESQPASTVRGIEVKRNGFVVNGKYRLIRGGTVQWFRLPEEVWEDRLLKFKAAGFNTIDMYVSWNNHEPSDGKFDFETPSVRRFLELAKKHGLFVLFRPGPYFTNEYDGGGLPAWLLTRTTKKSKDADGLANLRTDDPDYLAYVKRYFSALNAVVKPYLASRGGPVILYSIENEYDWFEIFAKVDKTFMFQGGPERGVRQSTGTAEYFSAMRDMLRADGIDVPIVTCPGSGKVTAMGDIPGVIPMPNIYYYMYDAVEPVAYDVVQSMHDRGKYNGNYVDYPSGTIESERQPATMTRFFMGGLDAVFAFNVAGMFQEGYRNSLVMYNPGIKNYWNLIANFTDFRPENLRNGFVSPQIGYFHNVVDYYGPISASGGLRAKFFSYRRTNMFYDAFEEAIARVELPRRSSANNPFPIWDKRLSIDHPNLGVKDKVWRVHYWLDAGDGNYFISLLNETGAEQKVRRNGIKVDDFSFPQYTDMVVAPEKFPGHMSEPGPERYANPVIVVGAPLGKGVRLKYSTSEILTLRDFAGGRLLVVHGPRGAEGELVLDRLAGAPQILSRDAGIRVAAQDNGSIALAYKYGDEQVVALRTAEGTVLRIVVADTDRAGRFWFTNRNGQDHLFAGFDYLAPSADGSLAFEHSYAAGDLQLFVLSPRKVDLSGLEVTRAWDAQSLASRFVLRGQAQYPAIPANLLAHGKAADDAAEAAPGFDSSRWIAWQGEPRALETLGISGGHAWYRAEVDVPAGKTGQHLFVEHASDIVGIYVNGQYLTTVAPVGTEIDGNSGTASYRFPVLDPWLKPGRNVIAFRTEVWGHGSFMWPRGVLLGGGASMPGLGFDAVKGLFGKATLGGRPLERWSVRSQLGGEAAGFGGLIDDSGWRGASIPLKLGKGAVTWYRVKFSGSQLPNRERYAAPLVLELKGRSAKATVFLNGRLIGRWLSDTAWLGQGTWVRGLRDMWMNTNPDHFPLAPGVLKDGENVLSVAFEDTSDANAQAGEIASLAIRYNAEEKGDNGSATIEVPLRAVRERVAVNE